MNQPKPFLKVISAFKVPDKRWWWIKIRALASIPDWQQLEQFAKEKKNPVGFAPFATVCLEKDEITEAVKYIPRIADPEDRVSFFIRVGAYVQAAMVASKEFKQMDPQIAHNIVRECSREAPEHSQQVEELLSKFL